MVDVEEEELINIKEEIYREISSSGETIETSPGKNRIKTCINQSILTDLDNTFDLILIVM